jgi:hypothetical protein
MFAFMTRFALEMTTLDVDDSRVVVAWVVLLQVSVYELNSIGTSPHLKFY